MALNANALTTLAKAKSWLDIPTAETAEDTRIELLINAASQLIEKECQRVLIQQSYTEYFDGARTNRILLPQWPAQKPSEVNIDASWVFGADTALASTDYEIQRNGELVLKDRYFPRGDRNIKVTYIAGYSPIPPDLEMACLMLTEYYYQIRSDRRNGIKSKSKNGENISFTESIPEPIRKLLENYIRLDFVGHPEQTSA